MSSWRQFKTIKEIDVDGRTLQAEVWVDLFRDNNYGADADGRRGVVQDFIDDWGIEGIFDLESGDEVTDKYKNNRRVLDAIEKGI